MALKMMNNLREEGRAPGASALTHLQREHGAEHDLPLRLPPHPGVGFVLHHFTGSTAPFTQFLHLLMPSDLDVCVRMATRTSFVVLPLYQRSLRAWFKAQCGDRTDGAACVEEVVWRSILLQALDVLKLLQQFFIVHRDIKVPCSLSRVA